MKRDSLHPSSFFFILTPSMVLTKLVLAQFSTRKVRTALTVLAILFSVALVVAVTSGYASAQTAAEGFLAKFMGASDAQITKQNDPRGGVDEQVVRDLRTDPDVQSVIGRLESESQLLDKEGTPIKSREAIVTGIRRPEDREVDQLNVTAGKWFNRSDGTDVVVDQAAADALKVKVGDTFKLPSPRGPLDVSVVGIIRKPGLLAMHTPTIYVPLETLQKHVSPNNPDKVSRASIILKRGVDAREFADRWKTKLQAVDPTLRLRLTSDQRQEMSKNLAGMKMLSYLGGLVSMVAATFIVFSTLSMGVTERQRTLAMMRAIGAVRSQVARLVVVEALLLSFIAVAIGVPVGILFVKILTVLPRFKWIFEETGVTVDRGGILLGGIGSIVAAVLASLLPAWQATRVDPLAAMTPLASPKLSRFPTRATIFGLILIALDPLLLYGPVQRVLEMLGFTDAPQQAKVVAFLGHFILGLPGVMIGFFLLAPAFVWTIEKLLGPLIAAMFGLRYALLRQQLSGGLWRAAGTCASLMVGLAILIVLQTQGKTMLNGWKLPDKFPDVFIFSPSALGPDDQTKLRQTPGIKSKEVMPLAIASPQLGGGMFALASMAMLPDATMFFGMDPDLALKMMELEFRDNSGRPLNRDEQAAMVEYATEKLKLGRHIIVTDEFRQLKGVKVGDKLPLRTSRHGMVDYTICGIVWSPGIDVMASRFDLGRQLEQRTAASVFGSLADIKEDFGVTDAYLFAANLEFFTERDQVVKDLRTRLAKDNIVVSDVRQIKKGIQDGVNNMLLLVSTVAFAAMGVASLGVTNTIMASVRTRRWQFGVLRAIGVTRSQLLRMVVAESMLLGIVGVCLGIAAGLEMAISAKAFSQLTIGYAPPTVIPWGIIVLGSAIVMAISIVASLWPAISTARTQPLDLLSAGRASA